jgi:hypothetical protein
MTTPADTQTAEVWIDAVNAVFGVDAGGGKTVRTPKCSGKAEYPEALPDLSQGPVALSFPLKILHLEYGAVGSSIPTIATFAGKTELHLTSSLSLANFGYVQTFWGRVIAAAKAHVDLFGDGKVHFELDADNPIEIPPGLQYNQEAPHLGMLVYWTVIQDLSGQI